MKKLKKNLSVLFGMFCMMIVFCVNSMNVSAAEQVTDGDWTYNISNGVATIAKYSGTSPSVTIPTSVTIDGQKYSINKVEAYAFENNNTMTQLYIPSKINVLGNGAFRNCTALSYIEIQGDLTDCAAKSTSWDPSWKNDHYTTYSVFANAGLNADGLTVAFTDEVTRIPAYLFATAVNEGNSTPARVTKVVLADSVEEIGNCAFYNCTDLTDITFGGVKTIGENAFGYNTSLKNLVFGDKVQTIGTNAFRNAKRLVNVTFSESITTMNQGAFYECVALKQVILPSKLTTIGENAFENCTSLESISLPKVDCTIKNRAFKNCTALSSITVNGNIADCAAKSTNWDPSWKNDHYTTYSVFSNAGLNADGLTVTFAEGVKRVPAYLFATAVNEGSSTPAKVTKVVFADSVEEIGKCAFYNCTDLTDITFGGVKTIGENAFGYNTSLKNLVFGDNVQTIGTNAFRNAKRLETVTFSESITAMNQGAFYECVALKQANFPSNLATIGENAFENCTSLESISLPKTDCTIHNRAFKNCTALSSITVNGNIADCADRSTNWDPSWNNYHYTTYSVFSNAGLNANGLTVTFAEGVTRVPANLFATAVNEGNSTPAKVTKVVLSSTVNTIGKAAFYNCTDLKVIENTDNLTTIDKYAFAYCKVLEKVTLENCIESIGDKAFTGCEKLTINGYSGSVADTHAAANNIPFVSLGYNDGWVVIDGVKYWYENGVRQGTEGRGKEIYDPDSDAWYWLDAPTGAMATSKDVYQESDAGRWADRSDGTGKWVRYDAEGHMIKGWQTTDDGKYYFDQTYGAMVKGFATINGREYYFDTATGLLQYEVGRVPQNGWKTIDGYDYWYEDYIRQGYSIDRSYRGKEIYDEGSNAWYWLDNVDNGRKAVSKDVYQESAAGDWADREDGTGKWVRYDAQGHMIKGWQYTDNGTYFFDYTYGTMAKGDVVIEGKNYSFDSATGLLK